MSIRIEEKSGSHCPVIRCDVCRERFTDARHGNVCYPHGDPIIICKGQCDRSQPRGDQYPWMELTAFLVLLNHNAGMTGEVERNAKRATEWLERIA
jgi:hypothetical protein